MAAALKVEWVEDAGALEQVRKPWDRLAAGEGVPFARHAWFASWWRAFGRTQLAVATAWAGDELQAVLPLASSGSDLRALANEHTPIFRPFGTAAGLRAVASAAFERSPLLTLPALTEAHAATQSVIESGRTARRTMLTKPLQQHAIVHTHGSWATYRDAFDKRARKDIERRRRRLQELGPTYRLLEKPIDLEAQLTLGFHAEAAGWKGDRGTAIQSDRATERFYRELAAVFAEEDRFRISAIELDGAYAAFDYCILDGGRAWILKGGFDEQYRRFAPGLVLTLGQIERAFEEELNAVELLGEPVPWKLRFANDARTQIFVGAYGRRPIPLADYAYRRWVREPAQRVYRELPGRARR